MKDIETRNKITDGKHSPFLSTLELLPDCSDCNTDRLPFKSPQNHLS
jgi:hypothetical protein